MQTTYLFASTGKGARGEMLALRTVRCAVVCLALLGFAAAPLGAQTAGTGALSGTVTDPSGAAVVGAQIKVTSEATGEQRAVTSSATGFYAVALLLPGAYELEVSRAGFKTVKFQHVLVFVTETTSQNVRLEIGEVAQTVTVEAAAEQLQTESSTLGRVTSGDQVNTLPLVTRNFTQIIALNPGVSSEVTNAGEMGRGGGGNNQDPTVSNGNWAADNNFQMNGVGVNDIQQSGFFSAGVAIPNPDTIQEFKVQTSQYDASYGRNAGANVDVVTKGGTNEYHGSLWEYFRNDVLNANTFFRNAEKQPRPVLRQNQFGFTFGGPVKKNKLQFFTSYQGTRQRNGLDLNCSASISEAPLTNDRSAAALGKLFAGQTGVFGGTAIASDGSNINPVALALLNFKLHNGDLAIPSPQTIDTSKPFDSQGFLALSSPCPFTEDQFMTNSDYEQSDKSKFSARFFFANSGITFSLPQTNLTAGGSPPGFPVNLTQNFRNFSLTHSYLISPKLLNQAEFGFHRILGTFDQSKVFSYSQVDAAVPPFDDTIPAIAIDFPAATGMSLGGNGQTVKLAQNTFTIQDSLSWNRGRHSFRFGAGLSREQNNQVGFHYLAGEFYLSWADFLLGLPGGPAASGGNGTPFSNLFGSLDLLGLFDRAYRDWEVWSYAQDDIKLTTRLTVNLGLRYDRIGDFGDALGRNSSFDSSLADPNPPAGGTLAGTTLPSNYRGGPIPPGVKQLDNDLAMNGIGQNTWNPRVGFAWQIPPANRLVLRGGYGVYHSRDTGQPFIQLISAPPYAEFRIFIGPSASNLSEQAPLPLNAPTFSAFVPYSPTTSNSITVFDPNYRPPLIQQFSLNLQTQVTPTMVLEVGYSGARGLHLIRIRSINQAGLASPSNPIRGETTNTLDNLPLRVPFEGWAPSSMQQIESAGASWYNALLISLNKRFSRGLQFQASYTFAKDLATDLALTTGPNGGNTFGNQNVPKARYGPDNFVRPHRFVVNYTYQLPKPQGHNAFLQQALGGWVVAGVTTFQTGHYLTVTYNNGASIYGIPSDLASLSGTCTPSQYVNPGSVGSNIGGSKTYINTSCFTAPANFNPLPPTGDGALGFGNAGVGILQGPGQLNFDFALIKRFSVRRLKESAFMDFRTEFFNAFNHSQFADPDTGQNDPTFGQITNTSVNPRIVQFALKFTF